VSSPAGSEGDRWLAIALGAGLVIAALATFWPAHSFEFVKWDDDIQIMSNSHIRSFSAENLRWMLTDVELTLRYVPLSWITWTATYRVFGLDPGAFHILNLSFHALSTVLVFLLLRKLLELASGATRGLTRPEPGDGLTLAAAAGALLWTVHPLHAEVVGWATQARYGQSLVFFLLSLLLYLRSARGAEAVHADPRPRTRGWRSFAFWGSVLAGAASALSYATGTILVPVLVILDAYPLRRLKIGSKLLRDAGSRSALLEKLPFLVVPTLVAAVTLIGRLRAMGFWAPPVPLSEFGVGARVMQACYVWVYYLWRPWVPVHLSPVYTRLVSFDPFGRVFVASALTVLAMTVAAFLLRRRATWFTALWVCHVTVLVPVLGLTEHPHYANDRYAYLQGILWSAALSSAFVTALRHGRAALATRGPRPRAAAIAACSALTCALALPLGVLARRQCLVWKDGVALFGSMIASVGNDPYRSELDWRLGLAKIIRGGAGDEEDGVRWMLSVAAPQEMLEDAGHVLLERGRDELAARLLAAAIRDGESASLRNALGLSLLRMHRLPEAAAQFSRALALDPGSAAARENLGVLHLERGEIELAIRDLDEAVRLEPGRTEARRQLEVAIAEKARRDLLPGGPDAARAP